MAALHAMARAGANDTVALAVLRQAVHDRDVMVRTNAVAGLWHATNDLSEVVPHWLLLIEQARPVERLANDDAANAAASVRDLAATGAAALLKENGRKRPIELCDVLISLLGSDLGAMRRAAALHIAEMAADTVQSKRLLKKGNAAKTLRKLLDDPEEEVRSAAAFALHRVGTQPTKDGPEN